MAFKTKILIVILAIVGFDAIASLASRVFQFDYADLVWVSLVIYVAAGYWGAHGRGFRFGLLLGVVAGLTDSTLGWWTSTLIHPFSKSEIPSFNLSLQLIILITVTAMGFLSGLLGAGLCKILGQAKPA